MFVFSVLQKPQGFEVVDVHSALKSPFHSVDNPSSDATSLATPEVASLDAVDLREVERLFKAIKDKDLPLVINYDVQNARTLTLDFLVMAL